MLAVSFLFIGWYVWYQVHEDDVVITPTKFKMSAVVRNVFPMVVAIASYIAFNNYYLSFGLLALYYMLITTTWDYKKILSYVNWEVLIVVGVVIVLGNYFKANEAEFKALITESAFDPTTLAGMMAISAIGFAASFLMGSSGKFIAFAVLLAQLFGMEYFLWFFAVDYAGYLLSPTHKCVMVGNRYFGTPYSTYYKALGAWGALLLITGGLITFVI